MGLTGGVFVTLMIGLAAGSVALIVWLWPRLAGQRAWHLAARLAVMGISQALVIAAFGVWVNAQFGFYGSWSDLLGSGAPPPSATTLARTAPAAGKAVVVGPPQPFMVASASTSVAPLAAVRHGQGQNPQANAGRPAQIGQVLKVSIQGQRTGLSAGQAFVYLPPQYFQPAYAHTRFPASLVFTGYPGGAWSIVHLLGLPAEATTLIAAHQLRPTVFVLLNVSPLQPLDTECTDVPGGPQVETFFAQDVPHAIEQAFRVTTSPAGWGTVGYSTGGYCAAKLAMMYPDRFSAAVSIAGDYTALSGVGITLWDHNGAVRNENNLDWRLAHLPAPPVSVLVTSSRVGERSLPGTLRFLHLVHPPMRAYSLIVPQGGHNFGTWRRELPQSLTWLSHHLS